MNTVTGAEGLRSYWVQRLTDYPASELDGRRNDNLFIQKIIDGGCQYGLAIGANMQLKTIPTEEIGRDE